MNTKRFLALLALILFLAIVTVFVLVWSPQGNTPNTATSTNPFGDTSGQRPFGTSTEDVLAGVQTGWLGSAGETTQDVALLRRITADPTAGAEPFLVSNAGTQEEYVRYLERKTGTIRETPLARTAELTPVAQKTIVRIGEGVWSRSASSTVARFLDDSGETLFAFLGTIGREQSTGTTSASSTEPIRYTYTGRPLPNNITTLAFSPSGTELVYFVPTDGGSVGYVENVLTGTKRQVFSSPFKGLQTLWHAQGQIVVYNNPATSAPSAVWSIDPVSGASRVLLSGKYALMANMNSKGDKTLYSFADDATSPFSLQVANATTKTVTYLPLTTLAEKCVWGIGGSEFVYCAVPRNLGTKDYLEKWYKGLLASDDILWRFNVLTGMAKKLIDPVEQVQAPLDMIDLAVSPKEDFLTFRAKKDSSLWAVRLPVDTIATTTVASSTATSTKR